MQRAFRSLIATFALISGSLLGHHLAGGSLISGLSLLTSFLSFFAFTFFLTRSELEGPKLGSLIIFTQGFAHLFFGSNTGNSVSMVASHAIFGLFTYAVIANLDDAIDWLATEFTPLILGMFVFPQPKTILDLPNNSPFEPLNIEFALFQYWTTSPPLVAKNS